MEINGTRELRQQLLYLHLFDLLRKWSNITAASRET